MLSSHPEILQAQYPWTSTPLIVSAPMRLIATERLAVSVSKSTGFGFIGAGTDVSNLSTLIEDAISAVKSSPIENTPAEVLPIGVGFICWGANLATVLSVIKDAELKPAAAWLFAPKETKDFITWTDGIKMASDGKTKIWIQVGTVKMAIEAAKACRPDVLVIQGADAGGHGLAQSSSIISLLPECADALKEEGFGDIPLIAAGGIVDGRGIAAAVVLGASGVCMGTRFLATPEAMISQGYRQAVIAATDGGVSTARTNLYDRLRGTIGWPAEYNGRGVLNQSFWDHEKGLDEDENKKMYEAAIRLGDAGWGDHGRMTTYAGTGIGLVKKVSQAGDIVQEVLRDSRKVLAEANTFYLGK